MSVTHDNHTHVGKFKEQYYDYHAVFSALKNNGITETTLAYLTPKFEEKNAAVNFYHETVKELKEINSYASEINLKVHILHWAEPLLFDAGISLSQIFSDFAYSGIALHPMLHDWTQQHTEKTEKIFEFAKKEGLPIFIHTGISKCDEPQQFEKWFLKYPAVKVHLAHCKDPDPIIQLFHKYNNLSGDTAFCPEDSYKAICDAGYKDRMYFGTDFPITHWYEHIKDKDYTQNEEILTKSYSLALQNNCYKELL